MRSTSSGILGAVVALGVMMAWLGSPMTARALEVVVGPEGFARVTVPAVPGTAALWVDVEAPELAAADVILLVDGQTVALRDTPFGAGVILPHDGQGALLDVGLLVAATPDIAITLADADGRILLGDVARVALEPVDPDELPTAPPTPPATDPPATASSTPSATIPSPSATAAPSAPGGVAPPSSPPRRPGLPNTGADVPVPAVATALLAVAAVAVALTRKVER